MFCVGGVVQPTCYGISQKRFIRYLKNRTSPETDPGHLRRAKMELFVAIVYC